MARSRPAAAGTDYVVADAASGSAAVLTFHPGRSSRLFRQSIACSFPESQCRTSASRRRSLRNRPRPPTSAAATLSPGPAPSEQSFVSSGSRRILVPEAQGRTGVPAPSGRNALRAGSGNLNACYRLRHRPATGAARRSGARPRANCAAVRSAMDIIYCFMHIYFDCSLTSRRRATIAWCAARSNGRSSDGREQTKRKVQGGSPCGSR